MLMTCSDCGTVFQAKSNYFRRCYGCWRKQHEAQIRDEAFKQGYTKGYIDGVQARTQHQPGLDADVLKDAIKLCHPDRHPAERQDLANRVTAVLIGEMNGARS